MSDEFKIEVWPAQERKITQPFGVNPQVYAQFGAPGHTGIDVGGPEGSPIYAVAAGEVTTVRKQSDGFGNHVYVQHANGYTTIYAHMVRIDVQQGQKVQAGTVLGGLGNTGFSSGPHLHFELRGPRANAPWPRNIIDPTPFILPLLGFTRPGGPYQDGFVIDWGVTVFGDLAQVNAGGVSLRAQANQNSTRVAVVPEGTMMIVKGAAQNGYVPVQVPAVAIGITPPPPKASPEFPPMVSTVDGWGFTTALTSANGIRGTVAPAGINLRAQPKRDGVFIGLVAGGVTITITGAASGEYTPVRVARTDFVGQVNMVQASPPAPTPGVLSAHGAVGDNTCLGWGWTEYLDVRGDKAIVGQYGINLRAQPNEFGAKIGVVKGMTIATIVGAPEGDYTPVMVNRSDMVTIEPNPPQVQKPKPIGSNPAPTLPPPPPPDPTPPAHNTAGWAFTAGFSQQGITALVNSAGINLRGEPRRDAPNVGFVPGGSQLFIVGAPQGEYTPVRVESILVQAPAAPSPTAPSGNNGVDVPVLGQARLGLHASATPSISDAEINEFKALRPGMIKVLSFHEPEAVRQLVKNHPEASWVVRAFLDFGGRNISPDQFVNDTLSDTQRTLGILKGKDVVVELHNEPNLKPEGLGSAWADGREFNQWWLQVLGKYRQQLPGVRYIFPGLSPGPDQAGLRQGDRTFLEACRPAVNAADGLGMHAYWSNPHFPMLNHPDSGTQLVDDYIRRFPNKPIWITEASNNLGQDWQTKALEYIRFWQEMQKRASIQGITYFVASAAPGTFEHETWVGHGIAQKLGER